MLTRGGEDIRRDPRVTGSLLRIWLTWRHGSGRYNRRGVACWGVRRLIGKFGLLSDGK